MNVVHDKSYKYEMSFECNQTMHFVILVHYVDVFVNFVSIKLSANYIEL